MLVTFLSDAYESITMFGDVAIRLLKIMGYSEKALGTIRAEDIPAVTARLKNAVENIPQNNTNEETEEPSISLAHRAFPLIEMLNASAIQKCDVRWKIT
jgi:hypothetical protein